MTCAVLFDRLMAVIVPRLDQSAIRSLRVLRPLKLVNGIESELEKANGQCLHSEADGHGFWLIFNPNTPPVDAGSS